VKQGTAVAHAAIKVSGLLAPAQKIAEAQGEATCATLVSGWRADLDSVKARLATLDGLTGLKARLVSGWLEIPKTFGKGHAQTFLTTAQVRLSD